jgi:hypothetical protein
MNYLIHVSILLAGMYLFYWLLLRRETFFGLNRWILVGSLLIAVLLPLLKVPAEFSLRSADAPLFALPITSVPLGASSGSEATGEEVVLSRPEPSEVTTTRGTSSTARATPIGYLNRSNLLVMGYLLGMAVFTIAFLIQLMIVLRKRRNLEFIKDGGTTIYEMKDDTPPFSFGNWIFINPMKYDGETFDQILTHEKLHVSQGHTLDKLLAELVVIIFWFNPFAWLLRSAITKNLEYLTDAEMLNAGNSRTSYQLSLVKVSVPQYGLNLTTNYNESFLKKRVTMMNIKKSSARSSWKYLLLLPFLLLSVITMNARQAAPILDQAEGVANAANDNEVYKPSEMAKQAAKDNKGVMPIPKVDGKKVHTETITREFDLANANRSAEMLLTVHNITGEIKVDGYDGNTVKVTVEKTIKAVSDKDLQDGIREIQLGASEANDGIFLYLDAPFTTVNKSSRGFKVEDCGGKSCHNYQYNMAYHIQIPRHMSLVLSTINGGDIMVNDTRSRSIIARHISNSIYMKGVTGVKEVFTISGKIDVSLLENPTTATSFISTSGSVTVDVVDRDFGAEVAYSSISGKLVSSFPTKRKGRDNSSVGSNGTAIVGNGGPYMELRSISGDLVIK